MKENTKQEKIKCQKRGGTFQKQKLKREIKEECENKRFGVPGNKGRLHKTKPKVALWPIKTWCSQFQ